MLNFVSSICCIAADYPPKNQYYFSSHLPQIHKMMDKFEILSLCSKVVHMFATNTFFGACLYVNVVETPARKSLKTADAVMEHFQETFPRARDMNKPLAAIGALSGLIGMLSKQINNYALVH